MHTAVPNTDGKALGGEIRIDFHRYLSESEAGSSPVVQGPQVNNPHTERDIGWGGGWQGTSTLAVPENTN